MIRILRETHSPPADVVHRLTAAGGRNRFGEPNFRAVWGWCRLGWIGGKWEDRDSQTGELVRETVGVRLEPKYIPFDRWHIERWCPQEMYGSPEEWQEQTAELVDGKTVAALGPYPSRGEYEHVFTLEGRRGEFVQLTPAIVEQLSRMIEVSKRVHHGTGRESLYRREASAETRFDSWADTVLDDAGGAFHGAPHVIVPAAV
jgi:hypothetical protein